jgi:Holliday junction resolvase RusA-like endonuclease
MGGAVENETMLFPGATESARNVTSENIIRFTVYGTPVPQGSMRAFLPKGHTRPIITADNPKTKPWRQEIANVALLYARHRTIKEGPIWMYVDFFFERPKSLKKTVARKITKPDLSKLVRALEDALTGIIYKDDAQIVSCMASKHFGSPARCEVQITSTGANQ